jgi:hypothetical protein
MIRETKPIQLIRQYTNIQVGDKVVNINNDDKYSVAYIDTHEAKAVLNNLNYLDKTHILDLSNCDDFAIISYSCDSI